MIDIHTPIIMIDTETTNSLDDPLCYDIGFAVVDILGNVYESHSFVVSDVFCDKELMQSAKESYSRGFVSRLSFFY